MVPSNASGAVSWDFGDGTSSTVLSPTKTYTTATDKVSIKTAAVQSRVGIMNLS